MRRCRSAYLLSDHRMNRVFLVLADILDHVGVGEKLVMQRKRPRLGVRLRIVNGNFDVHVPEVGAAEAFDGVQGFGMRTAAVIEPALVIETPGINLEPVAVPLADGIAEPGWTDWGGRPSVKIWR